MTATAVICMDLQGLTPEMNRAVSIKIARNCAWAKVATEMQVAESTIWRWRQANPRIDELVLQAERENVHAAREKLSASLDDALESLRQIATNPAVQPRDRIAASKALLDLASKGADAPRQPAGARDGADHERDGPTAITARARVSANVIDVDAELEAELSAR